MPLSAFWPRGTSTTLRALNRASAMCYLCSGGLGKLYSRVSAARKGIAAVFPAGGVSLCEPRTVCRACTAAAKPPSEGTCRVARCLRRAPVPGAGYRQDRGPSSTRPALSPVSLLALQRRLWVHPLFTSLFARQELQGQLYLKKNGPSAFPAQD